MNIFEMIKHDAAHLLRIAAELIFPVDQPDRDPIPAGDELYEEYLNDEEPVLTLHLEHWPIELVENLMKFCLEEEFDAETGVAVLIAHALHVRMMKDLEFEEALFELLDEEAGNDGKA